METFGKIMAIILGMIIAPIIVGFVFLKLWAWFIVPITELQPLTLFQSIGLMFTINYLTSKYKKTKEDEKFWVEFLSQLSFTILMSLLALLSGWIITLFI